MSAVDDLLAGAATPEVTPPTALRVVEAAAAELRRLEASAPAGAGMPDGTEPAPATDHAARLLSTAAFVALPPPTWLVDRLIPAGALTTLYGPPGAGKSFAAIDLAASVALGRPWHGHDTTPGPVLYVILEGSSGAGQRVAAWCDRHDVAFDDLAIDWHRGPIGLYGGTGDADALAELVDQRSYRLVVVDTLARATVGAEENSARDMGLIVAAVARIATAGAAVLLVHHTGKDVERGARGSNALKGAVDAELEVTGTRGLVTVTTRKQKDAAEAPPLKLRIVAHGASAVLEALPAATASSAAGGFRPTTLMERVSERLAASIDGMSKRAARHEVTGNNTAIDRALDVLVAEGYATLDASARATCYRHVRPYIAAADPLSDSFAGAVNEGDE